MSDVQRRAPAVPVPVGVEQVLLLAGVEPRFAEVLRHNPDAALEASGVALSQTERAILKTVPDERLVQMAQQLLGTVGEPSRRVFLSQATAALAALGLGAGLTAGCGKGGNQSDQTAGSTSSTGDMQTMAQMRQRTLQRRERVVAPTGVRPGPWPHMQAEPPKIDGPIDKQGVRGRLQSYNQVVKRCWFSKNPRQHPKTNLRLDLTVDAKGKVSQASLGAGSPKNKDIESCILTAARAWTFPPSKPRPTKIQLGYTFTYRY